MADLGQWSGGTTSLLPTATFAAPNGLFPTQDRNDASYSFNSTTSTITVPSTADGYLVVAAFEFVDTSNGRCNPQGRLVLSSGSGNFVGSSTTSYNRNNSDDTAYVRAWAFIDSPSSAQIQFQWKRDSDAPTGGTTLSSLQITPLYYNNVGLYSSTQAACGGGTTPSTIAGFTSVTQSDTSSIELSSGQTVTTKVSGKRYLLLGSQYWQGIGSARSQRWMGFSVNGSLQNDVRANSYARNSANADIGEFFSTIVEGSNTVESQVFRGEALGTFPATGADVDGNTTGSNANHSIAVLELNDSAEVFRSVSSTQQNVSGTSRTPVAVTASNSLLDTGSFSTNATTTTLTANDDFDVLLGANLSGGYTSSSGSRYTGFAQFTIDGVEQTSSRAGDFARGSQGGQSTFGYSANLLSSHAVADTETLGVNIGRLSSGQAGPVNLLSGYSGMWGINLDTLEDSTTNVEVDTQDLSSNTELTDRSLTSSVSLSTSDIETSTEVSSRTISGSVSLSIDSLSSLTSVQDRSLSSSTSVSTEDLTVLTSVSGRSVSASSSVVTSDILSATEVDARSISSVASISTSDITSTTEVSDKSLGGNISVTLDSVEVVTGVGSRSLGGSTSVDVSDLTASTSVESRTLSSGFELSREDLDSSTSVLSISLTVDTAVSLESLESDTDVQDRGILLEVSLDTSDLSSETRVSDRTLSSSVVISTEDLQSQTDVEDRIIILPIPTPSERCFSVPSESRTGSVALESRVFKVDISARDLTVDTRTRVFLVPTRTRMFKT